MINVLRGILAIVLGLVAGGAVNMGLILLSPHVIPPPAGVNVNDAESLRASIHLFQAKHFLFPFLAHALGTLAGSTVAYVVAAGGRNVFAVVIGLVNLAGGIAAAFMIPAPVWFVCLDLAVAYLPMTWIATCIGQKLTRAA